MKGNYFIISNDGQMSSQEMLTELARDKIAPIMVFENDGIIIVPMFVDQELARRFAKRNTPKSYNIGTMQARDPDIRQIIDNGWEIEILTWPRKITNTHVEVLELTGGVEVNNVGCRRHM